MLEVISEHRCFGGVQACYRHDSEKIGLPMNFAVFHPPVEKSRLVPVLFYLAGLGCNEQSFMLQAGAQRLAARLGIMLVAPDAGPRRPGGESSGIENADWQAGGCGYYLDATEPPWNAHFRMESYVARELLDLIPQEFNADEQRVSICGHSVGGHGALMLALRHPERFRSVSALAPMASPMRCPWGQKAYSHFLGDKMNAWQEHDASELMKKRRTPFPEGILIDQGLGDEHLKDQLLPLAFEQACLQASQPLTLRLHEGYDHSYYFVASFIEDHLEFHQRILSA